MTRNGGVDFGAMQPDLVKQNAHAVVLGQELRIVVDRPHMHNLRELCKLNGMTPTAFATAMLTQAIDNAVLGYLISRAVTNALCTVLAR